MCPNPSCNEILLGKQFRCLHCHEHISWHEADARSFDKQTKGNDIRTQTLPTDRAKVLIQKLNERHTRVLVIRQLTGLGKDTLLELAKFNGELHLPDVQNVEPIIEHKPILTNLRFIYLDAIRSIDPIKHHLYLSLQAGISLSGLKTITPEIAQIIKSRSFPTHLNGITYVSDSVAEILENTPGNLRLDNLEQQNCPPLLQSRFLSKELRKYCDLISTLPKEYARSRKENLVSDTLPLNNVKELLPETAKELTGKHALELNGISEVTNELAEVLGAHEGSLMLDGVTEVSSPVLEALTQKPTKLSLRSIKSLPLGGLSNLEQRKNVTLKLFSLKRLSQTKASRLARLPITIVLDSGCSLSTSTVEILASGTAQFVIQDSSSVDPAVISKIAELNATNIKIVTPTELQTKIRKLLDSHTSEDSIFLTLQNTFSEHDFKSLQESTKIYKVIFDAPMLFSDNAAKLFSQCSANFVFTKVGKLSDEVLSSLLSHSATITFGNFNTSREQCQKICQLKTRGQLVIPSYLNWDLTKEQIDELMKNERISVPQS